MSKIEPQKSDRNQHFEIRCSAVQKNNHNCTPERQSLSESRRHRRRRTSGSLAVLAAQWQENGKRGAAADLAFNFNAAGMCFDQVFGNGEPQSRPT
jgi:hypothetical protein